MLDISPKLTDEELEDWVETTLGPKSSENRQFLRDFEKFVRGNSLWGVADWLRARQTPSKTLETFLKSEGLERP